MGREVAMTYHIELKVGNRVIVSIVITQRDFESSHLLLVRYSKR